MNRKNKFWSFLKGRGFYIALALAITGAGAAAWLTAQNTVDSIRNSVDQKNQPQAEQEGAKEWEYQDILDQQTEGGSSVEKPSAGGSLSTAPEPSSGAAAEVSAASEPPVSSAPSQVLSFSLPVSGTEILNSYSDGVLRKNYTLNVWRTHDGIDIAAAKGDPVCAVAAGTVQSVVSDPMWGGMVTVNHGGGYCSVYCGVAPETELKTGDSVTAGQVLGSVDQIASEIAMESHLHFAMTQNGSYIDPLSLLELNAEE